MADARSPEARIARLEACYARLEERINADRDNRDVARAETLRRLEELNHHAARADADRERFLTKEMYESRHAELNGRMESSIRELTARQAEHDRDDTRNHKDTDERLNRLADDRVRPLEQFKANIQGRMVATATIAAALSALASLILHAVWK